jgi:hypothetical protein
MLAENLSGAADFLFDKLKSLLITFYFVSEILYYWDFETGFWQLDVIW